ncbi:TonB-dependent receptor [Flavobacterium luminosum]|uniref:TonB-dependent receptor n=1 Tax=Flavobacterium luminosum TaxID=2949086 RepID=A0ABT0TP06_9FLAO|nr:TonB-dependent receptor [Flavobacterium sp. HXWNR70]MCL9809226.1 TonB-dependent receptor [Flavobacterium sp. HXWNR70]
MKKILYFFILLFVQLMNAQDNGSITGRISDENGSSLPGASVQIDELKKSTSTDYEGKFLMTNIPVGNYTLTVTFVGYGSSIQTVKVESGKSTTVEISLKSSVNELDEITVSANKKAQKITDVPATINIIKAKDIEQFSSFNLGELAARQKGVDFVRAGVLGTGINIRGFNSAFNSKNLQMTDDRISTLVATGLPLGTMETVIKDDTERVEILLGPNGTLYGPNAHNGLVNSITKSPFKHQGTTLALGGGTQNVFTTRLRHAQAVSDKFAYKFHFERSQGTEFKYTDTVYVGNTGYKELELDRDFDTQKYGAGLHYKVADNSELIGYYGHSNNNNIGVTSAGRNQIKDWTIDVAQLKYVSPRVFLNTYYTWSKTDDTYAMNQRTQNYVSFKNAGFSEEESLRRSYYEQWFAPAGIALKRGAVFKDASNRFNAEGQYNNNWKNFFLTAGVQYQLDMADSKGTYLLDDGGIDIAQTGVYSQFEYKLPESGWNFLAALRVDNHDFYGSNVLPKAAITKKFDKGTFRLTYGKGMAVPSILNMKANMFGGLVLGNAEGFTLSDGSKVARLDVESIHSYEVGYKGQLAKSLFIDANAYYNQSDKFISPLINIATGGRTVTHVGNKPIGDVVPGSNGAYVLTYSNFGKVDTYGFDLGFNYYFNDAFRAALNYSYFGRDLDKNDLGNDGDKNGVVTETDLPINTPTHKMSLGLHYNKGKFYGAIYGRYVQKYDFFSGINIAAKTQDLNGDGVNDVVENAKNGRTWNYGQLGGFTIDANAGYNFTERLSLGVSATNLLNAEIREFVASPAIKTLVNVEMKYTIDFFQKK